MGLRASELIVLGQVRAFVRAGKLVYILIFCSARVPMGFIHWCVKVCRFVNSGWKVTALKLSQWPRAPTFERSVLRVQGIGESVQDVLGQSASTKSAEAVRWLWQVFCPPAHPSFHPFVRQNGHLDVRVPPVLCEYRGSEIRRDGGDDDAGSRRQVACLTLNKTVSSLEERHWEVVQVRERARSYPTKTSRRRSAPLGAGADLGEEGDMPRILCRSKVLDSRGRFLFTPPHEHLARAAVLRARTGLHLC